MLLLYLYPIVINFLIELYDEREFKTRLEKKKNGEVNCIFSFNTLL